MKMRPSVSLQITKTQHIICKAHINGVACQLLVDTGASSSCIHSKLQEQFKLRTFSKRILMREMESNMYCMAFYMHIPHT